MSDIEEKKKTIADLEEAMLKSPDQIEMPVKHHFSHDCYGRELFIPKGTLLVGKIHKHETINILSKGKITIFTEEGKVTIEAPHMSVSKPGIKKVGYAHEDCVFINVHATKETDLDKIENEVIAKDYSEVELSTNIKKQIENFKGDI